MTVGPTVHLSREHPTNRVADEPPFFISHNNPPGSPDPVEYGISDAKRFGEYSSQKDSENDDLRDVIDDLTIENRKLKQLLKNRKGQKESQDRDKLFEVRVHGLPSGKKRELEALLRNFASNLSVGSKLPSGLLSEAPATEKTNVDSNANGAARKHTQTDSGYASKSTSEQTSATPSNPGRPTTAGLRKSNDQTIQSYLHNIPNGLLPRQPPIMSERDRMSLVVRRLENLFTGKHAAPGEHSQPLQQQEVSRLAASADMQRATKRRRQEGSREAPILPFDSEVSIERLDPLELSSSDSKSRLATRSEASGKFTPDGINTTSSGGLSPDQRPTRPLDLDVHRAQVAEENIEYIRHLGFTSPTLAADGDKEESRGWIYLNLLISMAQLHTINVTPGFVRRSINQLSAKFELSEDGNQVRWKGGSEATNLPTGIVQDLDMDVGNSANEIVLLEAKDTNKARNRMTSSKTQTFATPSEDHSSNHMISQTPMLLRPSSITPEFKASIPRSRSRPASSFDYKPILVTEKSLSRPNLDYLDDSVGWHSRLENSSTADSNDTSYAAAAHANPGPIMFYTSTLFCSDLSGDWAPTNTERLTWETSSRAVGVGVRAEHDEQRNQDASYFSGGAVAPMSEARVEELRFDVMPIAESCGAEHAMRELPASGIGGVTPQDNFMLDVKIVRRRTGAHEGTKGGHGGHDQPLFAYDVQACSKTDLAPSQLPPPSYISLPFLSRSSSGVESRWDCEDTEDDTWSDENEPVRQVFAAHCWTEDSSRSDGGVETDTDSSIDMLATARETHPTIIAAQEREFDLHSKPTPISEGAVTGSLAATAGSVGKGEAAWGFDEAESYADSDSDV